VLIAARTMHAGIEVPQPLLAASALGVAREFFADTLAG
jgi:hypothetical protein